MLGLAIYNGVLLDFPLPLALYRKILGQEVKLRDLEDMQPTLGRCGQAKHLGVGAGALGERGSAGWSRTGRIGRALPESKARACPNPQRATSIMTTDVGKPCVAGSAGAAP